MDTSMYGGQRELSWCGTVETETPRHRAWRKWKDDNFSSNNFCPLKSRGSAFRRQWRNRSRKREIWTNDSKDSFNLCRGDWHSKHEVRQSMSLTCFSTTCSLSEIHLFIVLIKLWARYWSMNTNMTTILALLVKCLTSKLLLCSFNTCICWVKSQTFPSSPEPPLEVRVRLHGLLRGCRTEKSTISEIARRLLCDPFVKQFCQDSLEMRHHIR